MVTFTKERVKIVEFCFQNGRSIIFMQKAYHHHFNIRNGPSVTMIWKLMQRLEETGSLMNLPHTGRPRSAHKEENIERVRASIEEEPQTSTRRRSRELGLSRTSLKRILTNDLKMFPYKI
jgi:biotin operon repressor